MVCQLLRSCNLGLRRDCGGYLREWRMRHPPELRAYLQPKLRFLPKESESMPGVGAQAEDILRGKKMTKKKAQVTKRDYA